jgi:biopolymer transport protein ExbD
MMFLTIADQLNEFDGEFDNEEEMLSVDAGATAVDAQIRDKRAQNKKEAKKREPQLNVEVDAKGTVKIESVNVQSLSVKYYIINAELLFSR